MSLLRDHEKRVQGPLDLRSCSVLRRASGLRRLHSRFHSVCIAVVAVTSGKTGSPGQDLSGHPRISGILVQKLWGWQTAFRYLGILWGEDLGAVGECVSFS